MSRTAGEVFGRRALRSLLRNEPVGDGHGVMVLPGFLGDDLFNVPLRNHLESLGYVTSGWRQGRNFGPSDERMVGVATLMERFADFTGGKITLIGHSLGGVYCREIAKVLPQLVRQVITLGSPFGEGQEPRTPSGYLFRAINPKAPHLEHNQVLHTPPPVPTTAIYTRTDGIVSWGLSVQQGGHNRCENIEVRGSHCGLTHNIAVWHAIADRLAQPAQDWLPFSRIGWREAIYPVPVPVHS